VKLYDYYRSTASYRVRIALNIKQIHYEKISVHLVNNGGEHRSDAYLELNPQGLVPTLDENGHVLSQSLAIIEYLNDTVPTPALLPPDPLGRAEVRSMALTIACEMHPLNNLRVLRQLRQQFQATEAQVKEWYHHWLSEGFDALEARLKKLIRKNPVCYGQDVGLADVCLVPQVYNAKRFDFSMDKYPLISEVNEYCLSLDAFAQATPQPEESSST